MSINLANIDVGNVLSGAGQLLKDIRAALTGKEPINADKAAELALKLEELQSRINEGTIQVALAEAQSQDKWTSRARPSFMYVIYLYLLFAIPMGFTHAHDPSLAQNITTGIGNFFRAIPSDLYALFGAGYLGYGAFRSYDKRLIKG